MFLVVEIPDANNSVFSTGDQVLAIWRDRKGGNLIVVAGDCAIELLTLEEGLCLMLNIPKNEVAVLRCSNDMLVIGHPLKCSNSIFMALHEHSIILCINGALPGFDQLVFRYSFEQGMSSQDCLHALSTEFPDVTRQQLSRAIIRVHGVLSPRQRWQIGVRHRRKLRSRELSSNSRMQDVDHLPTPTQDPAIMAQKQQELDALQAGGPPRR